MIITDIKQVFDNKTFQPSLLLNIEMSIEWIQDQKTSVSQEDLERLIGQKFIQAFESAKKGLI